MTKRVCVAAGLVAVLAAGSLATAHSQSQERPAAGRQRGPGPRGFGGDLPLRGLDLTDSQQQQARTIMESHRSELQAAATKLREAHRGLATAAEGDALNEEAIRSASMAVASAMADEAILRARIRTEVFAILTPEQQQKAKEQRERGLRGQRRPGI